MTTLRNVTQTCSICGASVDCIVLGSTNAFGSSDLDLRPPEMERSAMRHFLQECPTCGYVNGNLEEAIDDAKSIIESDAYAAIGADSDLPESSRCFAQYALLEHADPITAGISLLRAAWFCDDGEQTERARSFRNQAADMLLALQPFNDDEEQLTLATILVDILRRAERFEEARSLAASLQDFNAVTANDVIQSILQFQCRLCDDGDTGCYTVADCVDAT